ncbi:MAG: tyrosine--tRNA ligase [Puniceicoccales bacterium]|jgi:tyrosyl-tRNA synthetase|nr:tyrosine--tRNA ligase [Puniceicoccales bacterium]
MNYKPIDLIASNVQALIDREGLERKLASGRRLRIKLGVDPTRPDLTFGHLVVFNKLRQFQDLGHTAIFLIGDFTTTIGDPSGRSDTRPILTPDEIAQNAKTYLDQAFKVLDLEQTEVRYNSEWYRAMSLADLLQLAREMTVAQLIERDDFAKRYREKTPISLVEFLYPLIQGYDSVMLRADLEMGGSDQLFNMLVARALQKNRGMEEQAVLCMPLLVGLDGNRKMSKSFGNYISFNDSARDMFGKIMSIPDEIMTAYRRLLLCESEEAIGRMSQMHPMEAKKDLAGRLVARFYGNDAAVGEREEFERVFSRNELPAEMAEIVLSTDRTSLLDALALSGAFRGRNEIRRLLEQGAVRVNNERILDPEYALSAGQGLVIQVGKKQFFSVK